MINCATLTTYLIDDFHEAARRLYLSDFPHHSDIVKLDSKKLSFALLYILQREFIRTA